MTFLEQPVTLKTNQVLKFLRCSLCCSAFLCFILKEEATKKENLCIDDKYRLPIQTDVKMKEMTVITLTLRDISDEKSDETLLSEF